MFTGLVEDRGSIVQATPQGNGRRLGIRTKMPLQDVRIGDSIAVNGACLTVERVSGDIFEVVAGKETLVKTTAGSWRPGTRVHLERAMRVGDRLDGHMVQGHVDGLGRVSETRDAGESWVFWIDVGPEMARYCAPKGSICVDGVSLTVNEVDGTAVRLNIIPHTVHVTGLGDLRPGDQVNIETDVIARYLERLLEGRAAPGGVSMDLLRRNGFA